MVQMTFRTFTPGRVGIFFRKVNFITLILGMELVWMSKFVGNIVVHER